MTSTAPTGPITITDVRAALADLDPSSTNAGALRLIIGRGSYATIQKHLDAIRAERSTAMTAEPGVPAAPVEAIAAIWSTAWSQAQVLTLQRMDKLSAERDAAQALAATQAQDIAGLASEIDALTDAAEAQIGTHSQALEEMKLTAADATRRAATLEQELTTAQAEIDRLKAAASQATLLAERDALIERQALQSALDRQIERYTELKNVMDHLKPLGN